MVVKGRKLTHWRSFCRHRAGVHEREERLACLRAAADCFLDVRAICKCVVERVRHKESTEIDVTGDMTKAVATNKVSMNVKVTLLHHTGMTFVLRSVVLILVFTAQMSCDVTYEYRVTSCFSP